MKLSVSALSYVGPKMKYMSQLPSEYGIEIFWDWGNEDYFARMLPALLRDRTGTFSIHGPMVCEDISDPNADSDQFDRLKKPFDLYHRFDSAFYVLHTNAGMPNGITETELDYRRKLASERIFSFREICEKEGVELLIENIGRNANGVCLFPHKEFVRLFDEQEKLNCLLDTGHALISDFDISSMQKYLKNRIKAYHLHDNNGLADQHLRIGEGTCDWTAWSENFSLFTGDAEVVFEYAANPKAEVYVEDAGKL